MIASSCLTWRCLGAPPPALCSSSTHVGESFVDDLPQGQARFPSPTITRRPPAATVDDCEIRLLSAHSHSPIAAGAVLKRREAIVVGTMGLFAFLDAFEREAAAGAAEEEEEGAAPCVLTMAPSGLAFCDNVVGYGSPATKGQLIKAHYIGKLESGKVFDSSYNRGRPLVFRVGVGEVIRGWDAGIIGGDGIPPMLVGGKRTLKIPPQLAYGTRGAGCRGGSCIIPPDSVLLFDVEFVGAA